MTWGLIRGGLIEGRGLNRGFTVMLDIKLSKLSVIKITNYQLSKLNLFIRWLYFVSILSIVSCINSIIFYNNFKLSTVISKTNYTALSDFSNIRKGGKTRSLQNASEEPELVSGFVWLPWLQWGKSEKFFNVELIQLKPLNWFLQK